LKLLSMLRLFQAGVTAAYMQCLAILLVTPLVITYAQSRLEHPQSPDADTTAMPTASILRLIYLLIAIGLALTRNRSVELTAARIRTASLRMHTREPDLASNTLLVCLWFTAVGFGGLTLGPPPTFLIELGCYLGSFDAAPIIWSGFMSIGVASFGANAQAANRAQ